MKVEITKYIERLQIRFLFGCNTNALLSKANDILLITRKSALSNKNKSFQFIDLLLTMIPFKISDSASL